MFVSVVPGFLPLRGGWNVSSEKPVSFTPALDDIGKVFARNVLVKWFRNSSQFSSWRQSSTRAWHRLHDADGWHYSL